MSFIPLNADLEELRMVLAFDNLAWHDRANCKGANADLFFPERGASTRTAKGICRECQVRGDQIRCMFVCYLGSPGVHHGKQGHAEQIAFVGYCAQSCEHFIFLLCTHVYVYGDSVCAKPHGFLHGANLRFAVWIRVEI